MVMGVVVLPTLPLMTPVKYCFGPHGARLGRGCLQPDRNDGQGGQGGQAQHS